MKNDGNSPYYTTYPAFHQRLPHLPFMLLQFNLNTCSIRQNTGPSAYHVSSILSYLLSCTVPFHFYFSTSASVCWFSLLSSYIFPFLSTVSCSNIIPLFSLKSQSIYSLYFYRWLVFPFIQVCPCIVYKPIDLLWDIPASSMLPVSQWLLEIMLYITMGSCSKNDVHSPPIIIQAF